MKEECDISDISEPHHTEEEPYRKPEGSRTLLDSVPFGIVLIAKEGTFLYINPMFKELFGYDLKDIPDGRTWFRKAYPDPAYRRKVISTWRGDLENFKTGEWKSRDFSVICKDGTARIIQFKAAQLDTDENLLTCVDITERKKMEEALRESEEKYRQVVENANQGILIHQDGITKFPNPKLVDIFGYSEEELTSKPFLEFIHPDDREMVAERSLRRLEGKEVPLVYDFRMVDKDGKIKWVEINATLITWEGRPASLTFLSDISKRKEAQEKVKSGERTLRESEERLRFLSSRLLAAQETERKRISVELHDELGQALIALKLRLSSIQRKLRKDQAAPKEECESAQTDIEQIIEKVRRLSRGLRPHILEEIGLSAALRRLVDDLVKHSKIKASLEMADIDNFLSENAQLIIYRIFQEALTNMSRHAQASRISVAISKKDDVCSFLIEDNGKGFDIEQTRTKHFIEKGLGLAAMEERTRMLGGSLNIGSQVGKGTRISLTVPVNKEGI